MSLGALTWMRPELRSDIKRGLSRLQSEPLVHEGLSMADRESREGCKGGGLTVEGSPFP
jgi:hypothetical protein